MPDNKQQNPSGIPNRNVENQQQNKPNPNQPQHQQNKQGGQQGGQHDRMSDTFNKENLRKENR